MDDHERDLADAVAELSATLTDLRAELREPPTGPLGTPRPPTPSEFLRFTEQYTLPALISLLETSIRVLELLSASIRLVQEGPIDPDRTRAGRDDAGDRRDRLTALGRTTLDALDEALADLQTAAPSGQPAGPEVQRLLEEARELGAEVDARLADATTDPPGESVHEIDVQPGREDDSSGADARRETGASGRGGTETGVDDDDDTTEVDVDAELSSIKDELEGREQPGEAHGDTDDPLEDDAEDTEDADDDGPADGA